MSGQGGGGAKPGRAPTLQVVRRIARWLAAQRPARAVAAQPVRLHAPAALLDFLRGGGPAPIALAAAATVALGVALRMWRIANGLPDFLDEAIPWKTAFRMWVDERQVDWNPHFFNYPSLTIYLCLFLQKAMYAIGHALGRYPTPADFLMDYEFDPSPFVIAARSMGVAFDALTLVMVVRMGERLRRWTGVAAALVVALSPTMIATSRAIYTDTYMAAFAVCALERMLAFHTEGRPLQLAAATALIGLAAGSKYPGALLIVPLAWALIERRGLKGLLPLALACVAAAGVFLITSPYVLIDFERFTSDIGFERLHMAQGHLGNTGRRGFLFQLQNLGGDIGWIGVALLVVSLGTTLAALRRRGAETALWLFLLPIGFAISLVRVEAGRYLVPVVPVAATLAAAAAMDLARRFGAARPLLAQRIAVAALALPVLPSGVAVAARGSDDTQAQARRWCEAHITEPALILQEGYTGNLFSRRRAETLQRSRGFKLSTPDRQKRIRDRRLFDVAELPLFTSGYARTVFYAPDGTGQSMQVFDQPADLNQIFYDLRLLLGVDYVMTSWATRGRFEGDTVRFGVERRFYRFLDEKAEHVASFRPGRGVSGPTVDIYRIGDRAQGELMRLGAVDALWWARYVPRRFRESFEETWVSPEERSQGALLTREGDPTPWVVGLTSFFEAHVTPFARLLSFELSYFGRFEAASPLLEAIHLMQPKDIKASIAFTRCAAAMERWDQVGIVAQRTMGLADPNDPAFPEVRYMRALALARFGRREDALGELQWVAGRASPGSELEAAARAELRRLGHP